jgi:hypothetical protein
MPTISNKKNLGSIFGGKIASINYNFQTSSEPSTATITVLSENNQFIEPNFNDQVSIPPFGFQMLVTEVGTRKDSQYKTLQVELIDSTSKILDKELVLIFGEHTDLEYKLNNDLFYVNNSVFVPKEYYFNGAIFNETIKFPELQDNYLKSFEDGINVIGTARATYTEPGSENLTGKDNLKGDPVWITFQAGVLKEALSSYSGNFIYKADLSGNLNVVYGFTLKNLKNLVESKGLSFDNGDIMLDESLFFTESGTIREVLSACLSKIGRSFYVDPFTQKIVVISNADIAKINNNLLIKFSSFENVSGATQVSLKKSIADVEATHFVLKGNLDFVDRGSKSGSNDPRARKQVLYKLDSKYLTDDLKSADIDLIKRVAPAVFTITDEAALDNYVFALGISYPTNNWGILYGLKDYRPGEFEKKENDSALYPNWQREIIEENAETPFDFGFYDKTKTVGARPLYRGESGEDTAKSASEADFFQNVKDFIQLWSGTYFSAPMTEAQIDKREYQERAKWMLGLDNTFDFVKVNGEAYIQEITELEFLVRLLKRAGAKTNYKVKEIASKAYKNAIGDGDYFILGLRKLFFGSSIKSDEIYRMLGENFWGYFSASSESRYLLYTKEAQDVVSKVEEACLEAFEEEEKKVKEKLVVRYIKVNPDKDPNEESGQDEVYDVPTPMFLRNLNSSVQNFSKRSLTIIEDRYSEIKLFLENIGELNPEFSGPFITTQIDYFRPPLKSDFDISNGIDSVSISISEAGVTTSVTYSSRKFAQIDISVARDMIGSKAAKFIKNNRLAAFRKNQSRM